MSDEMTPEEFRAWVANNRLETLRRSNERMRQALLAIASLSEGPEVCGSFDEPCAASTARDALAADWVGPCAHGRDPWTRCDTCEALPQTEAWAMAAIAGGGR